MLFVLEQWHSLLAGKWEQLFVPFVGKEKVHIEYCVLID